MSKLKRSRALRRNLRKQARKGTLSARERKTLLQQEKRFRKARRPFMRGLGFGAGLGAGAAALLGAGGIAEALAQGLITRRQAEDMMNEENEQPDNVVKLSEDVQEDRVVPLEKRQPGELKTGAPEDRVLMGDIQVVGETPNEATRAVGAEAEGEEGEDAAEERQATPEDQARAERAAQRAERAREAGVDAALEAGLGGLDRPPVVIDDPAQPRERGRLPEVSQGVEVDMTPAGQDAAQRAQSRAERAREAAIDAALEAGLAGNETSGEIPGTLSGRNMLDYLDDYGRPGPGRMSPRPAQPLPVDRPDPRMGTTFDPLLEDAGIQRALRGFGRRGGRRSSSFAEGGRVDKSNDLVARIKRKYGLR